MGVVARAIPLSALKDFVDFLNEPSTLAYYSTRYPVPLPPRLRDALADLSGLPVVPLPLALNPALEEFFSLSQRVRTDEDVGVFLDMVDDIFLDDVGWPALRQVLDSAAKGVDCDGPRPIEALMFEREGEETTLGCALRGAVTYLGILRELDSLLENARMADPILAEAMWGQHAYWLKQLQGKTDLVSFANALAPTIGWVELLARLAADPRLTHERRTRQRTSPSVLEIRGLKLQEAHDWKKRLPPEARAALRPGAATGSARTFGQPSALVLTLTLVPPAIDALVDICAGKEIELEIFRHGPHPGPSSVRYQGDHPATPENVRAFLDDLE
ncbi:MAG: hypothetical protein V4850_08495 [Myxococcota bacterium]